MVKLNPPHSESTTMAPTMRPHRTAAWSALGVFAALTLLCSVWPASAFNLDVDHITRYSGRFQSDMFGFSVALHKEQRTGESWVLVGAPEAQSSRQRAVERGGAVYRCDIQRGDCFEVPFDQSEGNNRNASYHDIDNKSHQWFGATVAAAQSGSAVVACAPRYVNYPNSREERHDPVGTCWVARDQFARFNEYSPCRTSEWGYHRKGHCQAGLGASISDDGSQLFVGAPGSHYWQGQLFTVDATKFMPFLPPESIRVNATSGQLFTENLHRRPEVYQTPEGPSTDDDTYLGYSVAVGYFEGPETTTVAVGRPRGDQLLGKVEIYSWDLQRLVDISGDQLGGYFGYSLCASDMDGDGLDDLVVGAPLFTERNNEGKYETGRIYVFYQREEYEKNDTRDGINSRSRFGLSVSSLGDINQDGFGDIAVGAPYDNPEGRGAVYIYLGSEKGIREKPSQIIYAKDVSQSLSTFGFSVSGGLDLDNNYYPDLVVGAYESNSAAFFRARPIVKVNASVEFTTPSKQINLKSYNCSTPGSRKNESICFAVESCLIFDGVGADSWHAFNIEVILDAAKPRGPRIFFQESPQGGNSRNFTINAAKNEKFCRKFNVFIKPNIRDKLTPLEVEMRYNLRHTRAAQSRVLTPVLDLVLPPVKKDTLNIVKNCGPDNICIPDLKMKIDPSVEQYLLGSGEDFKLGVLVDNKGEDAFEASYSLQLPRGLNYINIERIDKNQDTVVQCSAPSASTNNTLICDIGNPLPAKKHVEFNVLMQPFYTEGLRSRYRFEMEVNSTNPEKATTRKDNRKILEIPISIQTDLTLMGASNPSDVHWNSMDYSKSEGFTEESEIGPQVVHVHTIHNKGPADIVEAEVFVVVPTSTFAGDNVLYLLEQPETDGPIKCEKSPEVNYLNLKLDPRRVSYLGGQERLTGSSEQFASKDTSSSSSSSSTQSVTSTRDQSSSGRGGMRPHEEEAPSEGGRRGGGSTYHSSGGTHKLVGTNEERTIHKDEGLENSERGAFGEAGFGEAGYTFQHSSHSFQNSSQTSGHVESQSGSSGPRVHSSTNFSASWSENGGPVHHYENHTSEGGSYSESRTTHHNGRGQDSIQHHAAAGGSGGRVGYNASRTHHSASAGSEAAQAGRGRYDSFSAQQNRTRVYSDGGGYQDNTATYHQSAGESHYSGRDQGDRDRQGYSNTGFRENTEHRNNAKGYYDRNGVYRNNHDGYHENEDDYNENDDYYDNSEQYNENERGHHDSSQDSNRRQGYNSTHGVFRHSWSTAEGDQRQYNAGRGSQWSSERDNVGHDNVNENERHIDGQYGNLDHRSRERTFQHAGNDYNAGEVSQSSGSRHSSSGSHHYSTSGTRGQSGTSHSQDQNYRGASHGDGVSRNTNISQYFSANWYSDRGHSGQNRGTDHYDSRAAAAAAAAAAGRDHQGQESRGTGNFYTSSVLIGGDGEVDLGYAARGYGQHQDSFSSSSSRHYSKEGHRRTTMDPDLADLGAHFTDRPEQTHGHGSQRDESGEDQLKLYKRYRRAATDSSLEDLVKCNATNCTRIHCILGPLTKGQEVRVALRMRVWVPTMKKLKDNRIIKTSSRMVMQVTSLPYIGSPDEAIVRDHEVFTDIVSTDSPTIPDIVPLWVVVLSAVAGTVILLLLIFLLWKCGFFKRNRPADAAEKEPLNRNGHYSAGDEAL